MDVLFGYGADLLAVAMGLYLLLAPRHFIKHVNEEQKRIFGRDTGLVPQGATVWVVRVAGFAFVAYYSVLIFRAS